MDKLYVNFEVPSTLREFIETYFIGNYAILQGQATYEDEECTIIQCNQGKYRSFEDIFILVNTYFENTSKEELLRELDKSFTKNNINWNFCPFFCDDIEKPVMCYTNYKTEDQRYSKADPFEGTTEDSWRQLYKRIE